MARGQSENNAAGRSNDRLVASCCAAIFAAIAALLVVEIGPATWALQLGDSDNFMRLAEVRDWLGGQSWWDIRQYRADPPSGLYTHWSRLADLPLAGTILLARLFTTPAMAERLALVVQPLLLLAVALVLIGRTAATVGGRAAVLPGVIVAALATPMLVQFVPGRVDHHGLQIVLVLVAMAALATGGGWRSGALAALAVALSLNVGMETAPYLVVAGGWVAIRWTMRGETVRSATVGFALGIAVLVPLLFVLTVPQANWNTADGDAIGGGHVVAALIAGLALAALASRDLRLWTRAAALTGLAAIVGAVILVRFPEIIAKPYAGVGPLLARLWMGNIVEMQSIADIWRTGPLAAIARIFFILSTAVAGVVMAVRSRGDQRDRTAGLAAMLLCGLILACWQTRALALATAVAAPVAGAALGLIWSRRRPGGSLVPFTLAFLLLSHIPFSLLSVAGPSAAPIASPAPPCNTPAALRSLGLQPRGIVLAPINLGGAMLALTPHTVMATAIHRNVRGDLLAYRVMLAAPDDAHRMVAGHADYLAWCAGDAETGLLVRDSPHGLLAQLRLGDVPPWLVPIGSPTEPLRLYRIRQD